MMLDILSVLFFFFRKSVEKIYFVFGSAKNKGHFTSKPGHIHYLISFISSYNVKCFKQQL